MGLIKVLIVDDEHYTRKVIRTLLLSIGCTKIHEANDGAQRPRGDPHDQSRYRPARLGNARHRRRRRSCAGALARHVSVTRTCRSSC